jgi:hypothetical protein
LRAIAEYLELTPAQATAAAVVGARQANKKATIEILAHRQPGVAERLQSSLPELAVPRNETN